MSQPGFRTMFFSVTAGGAPASTVTACTISSVSTLGGGPVAAAPTATSQSATPTRPTAAGQGTGPPTAAWPEYDANPGRTGVAPGLPAVGKLSQSWTAHLDGAVYGQ